MLRSWVTIEPDCAGGGYNDSIAVCKPNFVYLNGQDQDLCFIQKQLSRAQPQVKLSQAFGTADTWMHMPHPGCSFEYGVVPLECMSQSLQIYDGSRYIAVQLISALELQHSAEQSRPGFANILKQQPATSTAKPFSEQERKDIKRGPDWESSEP